VRRGKILLKVALSKHVKFDSGDIIFQRTRRLRYDRYPNKHRISGRIISMDHYTRVHPHRVHAALVKAEKLNYQRALNQRKRHTVLS
jgi:hypothetical protein